MNKFRNAVKRLFSTLRLSTDEEDEMRTNTDHWNAIWLPNGPQADFGMLVIEHHNGSVQKIPDALRPRTVEALRSKAAFYVDQINYSLRMRHGNA